MRPLIIRTGTKRGFLLMEVLLGITVLGLFLSAIGYTLYYGQESTIMSGDRIRAVYLSERALDAARAIRDSSFASLTAGTHGFALNGAGVWTLSGSSVVEDSGFTTQLTVQPLTTALVHLSAETKWKRGNSRSGSVLLSTYLSNWGTTTTRGDWSSISVQGSYTDGATPLFTDLAIGSGSVLFAAARSGNGLYVIDTSSLTSPTRINASFSLGAGAYDVAVAGTRLFVVTDDSSQEVRIYDVSSPSTFSSANLLSSYDLPGSALGRSLIVSGKKVYVGAAASGTTGEYEFYAFSVNGSGALTLLDSIDDDSSSVEMIALSGTAAYLASSMDSSEVRVVNTQSGANLVLMGGYNLSDRTLDALSIVTTGTSALVGTAKGSSINEVVLLDLELGGVPSPPPGPWYHEGSGSVVSIDADPSRCVAFFAAVSNKKALQIMNMRDTATLQELATYNSATGLGAAVLYDPARDRLFLATERAVIIFQPGTTTGTCP